MIAFAVVPSLRRSCRDGICQWPAVLACRRPAPWPHGVRWGGRYAGGVYRLGEPPGRTRTAGLTGRDAEFTVLESLIAAVRVGKSRVLVVHGEAGVGKSALLDQLAGHAQSCRVGRVTGVESEMELPFAGLHQLCAPLLDQLERLPAPQRDALRVTFGLAPGPVPDRFLVGLAVLTLLSQAAEQQPLICLVDDYQWLDRASARILAFVGRRLGTESVGLVLAARAVSPDLAGLPELAVHGLADADARTLLDRALPRPIDALVRDQIVAEADGNPLALLELAHGLTQEKLAGGFGLSGALPLWDCIEGNFLRRIESLPVESRLLLLVVAADPCGDATVVWRAAVRLGIPASAAAPATDAGLADFGVRPSFRHPLIRSTVYRTAPAGERRRVHRALAEAIDAGLDPDRHAWHRAEAADGPDEDVAAELELSAGRAQARGGLSAAAAFLRRAAELTLDAAARADRLLAAAQAEVRTGGFDAAAELLATVVTGPLTDAQRARTDVVRARLAFATTRGSEASPLLLAAAARLRHVDPALSRATYLDALGAALFAGRLALPGGDILDAARAATQAPPAPAVPRASDLLLEGTAVTVAHGYAEGLPTLRRALAAFDTTMPAEEELPLLWTATITAMRQWDDERWDALSARHLRLARETGALGELPLALLSRVYLLLFSGCLTEAAELSEENRTVIDVTGSGMMPYCALGVAAFRGEREEFTAVFEPALTAAVRRGEGNAITFRPVGQSPAAQRARRLPAGAGRRAGRRRLREGSRHADLADRRTGRSGRTHRPVPGDQGRLRAARRNDAGGRNSVRARHPGAVVRAAHRRPGGGAELPRRARTSRGNPAAHRTRPRAPAVRRVAAPGTAPGRGTGAVAYRARDVRGSGGPGVRGAGRTRAAGGRRHLALPKRPRRAHRPDRPGGADRPARARRPVQSRDRHPVVHQPTNRPVPPAQSVRQTRHHLAQPTRPVPARRHPLTAHPGGGEGRAARSVHGGCSLCRSGAVPDTGAGGVGSCRRRAVPQAVGKRTPVSSSESSQIRWASWWLRPFLYSGCSAGAPLRWSRPLGP